MIKAWFNRLRARAAYKLALQDVLVELAKMEPPPHLRPACSDWFAAQRQAMDVVRAVNKKEIQQ